MKGSLRGVFISFEGCDGSGKSTQLHRVAEVLKQMGYKVVVTREPGGTRFGEMVRKVLLDPTGPDRGPVAEMFLYASSRAELVRAVIKPALAEGAIVLSERFADSTLVYQGFAGGIPLEIIETVNGIATDELMPDLTLVFDITNPHIVEKRMAPKAKDKIESRDDVYHSKVREGYRALLGRYPKRIRLLDGSLPQDKVTGIILDEVRSVLKESREEGGQP